MKRTPAPLQAPMPRPRTPKEEYRPFDPSDYSAYEFRPDGTPVRVRPATRGRFAGWTGPISSYIRTTSGGNSCEMFGITRDDGVQKQVSRNTILKSLGQIPVPAVETEDPWDGPPGCRFPRRSVDDFPDYVADARGRVWRFQSPGRGRYSRPMEIQIVRPGHRLYRDGRSRTGYFVLDCVTGHRRYVTRERVLELAGWTEEEQQAARVLEIAVS